MKSINFFCDCCGKYISKEWSNRLKDKHMTFDHYHEEYTYFTIKRETVSQTGVIESGYVDLCVDCHNKYMDLVKKDTEE